MRAPLVALLLASGCLVDRPLSSAEFACGSGGPCAPDAAVADDAGGGGSPDASAPDAETRDAEARDAETVEAGSLDAALPAPDASAVDASAEPDALPEDASAPDAEPQDASTPDAEPQDASAPDAAAPFIDLEARSLTVTLVPTSFGQLHVDLEVCNLGTLAVPSQELSVELLASADRSPSLPQDTLLPGPRWTLPVIGSGACVALSNEQYAVPFGLPSGLYYYVATIDSDRAVPDASRANNTASTPTAMGVAPDLTLRNLSYTFVSFTGEVDLRVEACNTGHVTPSTPTPLAVYLSADTRIDGVDPVLLGGGLTTIPQVVPGSCPPFTVRVPPLPDIAGNFYLLAEIDPANALMELSESNNTTLALSTIPYGPQLRVDRVMGTQMGGGTGLIDLSAQVCNLGTMPQIRQADLIFTLSSDQVIGPGDTTLATLMSMPPLAVGSCATRTAGAPIPFPLSSATHYVAALVDPTNAVPELDETDNLAWSPSITIAPDLRIDALTIFPMGAGSFDVSLRLCNDGTVAADPARVDLSFSTDNNPSPNDPIPPPFSGWSFGRLGAGTCVTQMSMGSVAPGIYYPIATADPGHFLAESNELNNVFISSSVSL